MVCSRIFGCGKLMVAVWREGGSGSLTLMLKL